MRALTFCSSANPGVENQFPKYDQPKIFKDVIRIKAVL